MKFLRNICLLAGLWLGLQHLTSAQVFEWTQLAHNLGSNASIGQGATTDPAGNTYVGFGFKDSARVGGQLIVRPQQVGGGGLHLIKYDSTGRVSWRKLLTGVRVPLGNAYSGLKADPVNGGVFITGTLYRGAQWDGVPIPAAVNIPGSGSTVVTEGFYGKCDASGNLLWTRPLPADPNWMPKLVVDGLGNCFLSGTPSINWPQQGVATVGGQPIDSTEYFVLGNNAAGTGEWVRRLHATPMPIPPPYSMHYPSGINDLGLGPKAGGGCLVFGGYNEALYFGSPGNPPVLPSRNALNTFDDFIASVSPSGVLTWIRPGHLGDTPANPVPGTADAAADLAGNYYVTGGSNTDLNQIGYHNTLISLAKYDAAGNLLWVTNQARQSPITGTVLYNYNHGSSLALDSRGEVTILAQPDLRPALTPPTIGNFVLDDYQSLIHFSATGVPQWVAVSRNAGDLFPQTTYSYNDAVSLGVDARGNVYYVTAPGTVSPNSPGTGNNGLSPPTFLLGEHTQVGAGISVARIGTRHNTVRGRLYLDANGNGVRDAGEGAFPRNMVLECIQPTRASLGTLDTSGNFNVYVGAGSYSLAPPVPPRHYALTQPTGGPYTGSFTGYGRVDTARHFGFRPVPGQADLRATLTAFGAARPGFQARQRLTLENLGTTTIPAGTATVLLDTQASFVDSYPTATTTGGGRVVVWNYPAIAPFGRRTLDITTSLPATIALGTVLQYAASAPLAADVAPLDNSSSTQQTVTGSFDPNDLSVSYERLSPAQVAAGQLLDYTVRFQNMGSDTAFTVVVTDTLDFRRLDLTTLELVAESHPCQWSISGQGVLVLRFLSIHLPHRGRNELGSQGFARFRVKPRSTLAVGDVVHNHADIFFDYNAPVRTNTVATAVLLPTALTAGPATSSFTAHPNPATDQVQLRASLPAGGTVRLALRDALGRSVLQQAFAAPAGPLSQTLQLPGLRPGLYLLTLTRPDGQTSIQRLTIE